MVFDVNKILLYSMIANVILIAFSVFSFSEIWDKFKLMLYKKKGYGRLVIIKNNKNIVTRITPMKNEVKTQEGLFIINDQHIGIDPQYNCPSSVVTQRTGTSISIEGNPQEITPETIDTMVQRAILLGELQGDKGKLILIIGMCVLLVIGIIVLYLQYQDHKLLQIIFQNLHTITPE